MKKVTISRFDILRAPAPWPRASFENTVAVLMASKGLRLRQSFNPSFKDLLPPFRIEEDRTTGDVSIWQGEAGPMVEDEQHASQEPRA